MATKYLHSASVATLNPRAANFIWDALWRPEEPDNAANGQTFERPDNEHDDAQQRLTEVLHTRLTTQQAAALAALMRGEYPEYFTRQGVTTVAMDAFRTSSRVRLVRGNVDHKRFKEDDGLQVRAAQVVQQLKKGR